MKLRVGAWLAVAAAGTIVVLTIAAALVPITVRGTREKPQFGLDVRKVFK